MNLTIDRASIEGKRDENQDAIVAFHPSPTSVCLAVADGMGGMNQPKLAADTAVLALQNILHNSLFDINNISHSVIERINEAIVLRCGFGTGTTLTFLCLQQTIFGCKFLCMNVGDSPAYWIKSVQTPATSELCYIYTPHGEGNWLYSHLGGTHIDQWSMSVGFAKPGDTFLVCSDGLNTLTPARIRRNIMRGATASMLCQKAFDSGSTDNITVGIIRMLGRVKPLPESTAKRIWEGI